MPASKSWKLSTTTCCDIALSRSHCELGHTARVRTRMGSSSTPGVNRHTGILSYGGIS
ncbi:hypothetical protein [Rhizobium viscosum]|uniref:Uncharacterized protein n=1 Tax=Rhizobium viscosum TaxID=1673 RepID=A0ABR9IM52_RHIVS|nr:hypothetical protein [Rhizobium viscosum]MBE1504261.1 hypothetical protein [Rhizobium viscosum]